MMNDKDWKATAKKIYFKGEALNNERGAITDEISSIRISLREGLVDDKTPKKEVQKIYQEELHKESYRRYLASKVKDLKTMETDLMNESGEFDAKQLTFFEVGKVRKEFEKADQEEAA